MNVLVDPTPLVLSAIQWRSFTMQHFSNAAKVFRCIFTNHAEDTLTILRG